jgi:hypothetical protein
LALIADLFEGGNAKSILARAAPLKQSGVNELSCRLSPTTVTPDQG